MIVGENEALGWLSGLPEWTSAAAARVEALISMLRAENQRQNLVSEASLAQIWQRHIVDSAQLLAHVPRETSSPWLDLGTGAGFPGLVIAILRPECRVMMVESRARRITWLAQVCHQLDLERTEVVGTRLELVPSEPVCVISARAFAPLPRLLTLSARFSTNDTLWVLPKGRSARQELAELTGWRHSLRVEPSLTDPEAGVIIGRVLGKKDRKSK